MDEVSRCGGECEVKAIRNPAPQPAAQPAPQPAAQQQQEQQQQQSTKISKEDKSRILDILDLNQ